MTIALILTIAALTALLIRQHRKTRAAVERANVADANALILAVRAGDADILETKLDDALTQAAATKVELAVTRKRMKRAGALALKHAVAAERAEATCLPAAPFRTASDAPAAPYTGPDFQLALPPLHDTSARVTPIKRAAVKKAGVQK